MHTGPQRPLAPHVQAAIARGAQPKMAGAPRAGPQLASHVQRAIAGQVQAKPVGQIPGGRQVAPHVQRAIAGQVQAKAGGPVRGGGPQVAPHVQRAIAGPAAIQRRISYRGGSQIWVKDPIESLTTFTDFGITPVIVNTLEIPPRTNGPRILTAPDLAVATTDGQTEVSVRRVATQDVGYRMELPTRPPWSRGGMAKSRVKAALEMQLGRESRVRVPITDEETGTITFEVKGIPDDGTFADLVQRHETYHLNELKDTIRDLLEPWDTRLHRAQEAGTRWSATTREGAEAKLYNAMGGTPSEVGERFVETLRNKGQAFHLTAMGASPSITDIQRGSGSVRVYLRHPVELERWHATESEREREEQARQQAMDRSSRLWAQHPSSISSEAQGNPYILNDML